MARDNKTIGKFRLNGIKRAPAGVPQIEVTFDLDTNGILKVSAKDLDTGKQQSITITANEKMSDAEIEQAIRDAEQYAAQDRTRREALGIVGEAQQALSKTEQAMSRAAKRLDKEEKKRVREDIAALRKLLMKARPEKLTDADVANLRSALEKLSQSGEHVIRLAEEEGSGGAQ